jgi:hypothetical protein
MKCRSRFPRSFSKNEFGLFEKQLKQRRFPKKTIGEKHNLKQNREKSDSSQDAPPANNQHSKPHKSGHICKSPAAT